MVSETRNIGLPYQRKWRVQIHTKINTSNGSDFDTVGTYDFCCGNVGLRPGGGVICVALSWRTSGHWFPFLVGWVFSLALKWLRARTGWGDPGVAWSRVMAKFYLQPPHFTFTFPQIILLPPKCYIMFICSLHISLSLSTHHLAAIILHLPDHGMPPQDLPPPSAALYGEATSCWYFPPLSLPWEPLAASPVGRRLRPAPPCMGIFSLSTRG